MQSYKMYVDGERAALAAVRCFDSVNPYTEVVWAHGSRSSCGCVARAMVDPERNE